MRGLEVKMGDKGPQGQMSPGAAHAPDQAMGPQAHSSKALPGTSSPPSKVCRPPHQRKWSKNCAQHFIRMRERCKKKSSLCFSKGVARLFYCLLILQLKALLLPNRKIWFQQSLLLRQPWASHGSRALLARIILAQLTLTGKSLKSFQEAT